MLLPRKLRKERSRSLGVLISKPHFRPGLRVASLSPGEMIHIKQAFSSLPNQITEVPDKGNM
jgi:hypothetical protein